MLLHFAFLFVSVLNKKRIIENKYKITQLNLNLIIYDF